MPSIIGASRIATLLGDFDRSPAYAGLADTHLVIGSWFYGVMSPRASFAAARAAAEIALRRDPGLAEAYATLGWVQYGHEWDWAGANRSFRRAVELNPRHFPALKNLAVLYEKAGFKNKAVEMWERSVNIAPDSETRESIKAHLIRLL